MANLRQSRKRVRQNIIRRIINKKRLSFAKMYIRKFLKALNNKDLLIAKNVYNRIVSNVDKCVSNKLFSKNKANRIKSRLNKKLKVMVTGM